MKSNLKMKLANIQVNLKSKKVRKNNFGNYNYRAAEDILKAIKPFLDSQKCTVTINEEMLSIEPPILKSTASILDAESDETIHSVAIVGVDLASKGMSMPQKYGAASSYAKKYALGNLFLIDNTEDADAFNNHGVKQETKAVVQESKINEKAVKNVVTHINLDIGDENWFNVLSYIGKHKDKGLNAIVQRLSTKYNIKTEVKKVIAKEISNAKK